MPEVYHNYIGGRWVPAKSGRTFQRENPATGETIGEFADSGAEDVAEAVSAAAKVQAAWRATPAPRRAEVLFRAAEIMVQRKEELARDMSQEMGKVLKETRGDVQEAIDMTYYMAGEGRRTFGQTTPSELPNKFAMSVRMPLGVVAAITPWNFPLAIPCWKVMPALVTGNTVVLKPSPYTPRSAWHLAGILEEAGLPPGVFNLILGGDEAGAALVGDPGAQVVSFTGSNEVGMQIGVRCAQMGKRLHLEMGGKNAIIVMEDADRDLALDGIIWSAFGTSGQRCTAASRIIVQRSIAGELTERLVARAQTLRLGNPLDESVEMGPVVSREQLERVERYMPIGLQEGAAIACGGGRASEGELAKGYFFQPTVFVSVQPHMRIAQEEIFGPVTAVITVDTLDEAIAVNNDVPYGLSSAIFTRDVNKAFRAIEGITTGIVYINAGTIGAEVHLPFGGTRGTGNGHREAGQAALDTYTEWKTVYIDYSGKLQKAQIDK